MGRAMGRSCSQSRYVQGTACSSRFRLSDGGFRVDLVSLDKKDGGLQARGWLVRCRGGGRSRSRSRAARQRGEEGAGAPRRPAQRPGHQRPQPGAPGPGSVQREALLGPCHTEALRRADSGAGFGGSCSGCERGRPCPLPALLLCARRDPSLAEKYKLGLNKILAQEVPIEIKPVNLPKILCQRTQEPKQMFWVRAQGYIGECDMKLHCCVAAYISDYAFLGTALLPHRQHPVKFMVSLDHSMWFHAPFRADHWMLYECESPWAGGCRGLVQGRLWRRDGVLAVTCAQEGAIRVKQCLSESKL
ncbi:acyl-coenzyme A thioesterase 8 isoform X2 [Carettochelys insculpta]|uniref:acyl-coenzyme A thioesterase 8 isoform X2 n=1 Tax=Carettochelys insculpta TaxID=44489 RepID=UPI003EC0D6DC